MFPGSHRRRPTLRGWTAGISEMASNRHVFPGRGRVALEPGPRLGTPGSGFVRLNFGTSEAALAEAIERMASALS
jgi:bifunctional pyridoxal-dependent enzyme with beta-cystathionase and maltose regulon repressor activities